MKRGLFILFLAMLAGSLSAQYLQHRRAAFRGGGGFSPSDISGMIAWYAADDISSSDGTEQTSWSDLSGNGYTLTAPAGSGPTWETSEINGLPAMFFSSTSMHMTNTSAASNWFEDSPYTCIAVVNQVYNSGNNALFALRGLGDTAPLVEIDANTTGGGVVRFVWVDDASGSTVVNTSGPLATNQWHVLTIDTSGLAASVWYDRTNTLSASAYNRGATTPDVFTVGNRYAGGNGWNGMVAELIFYDSQLSATNRNQIEDYLSDKYNITLGPY